MSKVDDLQAQIATLMQISRGLSTARDDEDILQALAQPAIEAGASVVDLAYIDLDDAGEPEWVEIAATWRKKGPSSMPAGSRFYLPEFPMTHLWTASSREAQFIADVVSDEHVDENAKNLLTRVGIRALAIIPLAQSGRWAGIILYAWDEPHTFSSLETAIAHALIDLVPPAVENRRLLNRTQKTLGELRTLGMAIEQSMDGIAVASMDGTLQFVNPAWAQMHGCSAEELLGKNLSVCHTEEQMREEIIPFNQQVMATGANQSELGHVRKDGVTFPTSMAVKVLRDEQGNPIGLIATARDITERKRAEEERERLQQEVIEAQQQALRELSTPIIPVMEGIIVMPLIGSIDTMRARDIMRTLMQGISTNRAKVVILDITGVPLVDSGVADHLNKTIQAARLKGTRTIVTGVSDAVAETIVDLGIDWGDIETLRDLQTGLLVALRSVDMKLSR